MTNTENGNNPLSRKRAGVRRMLKHSLKVDMTPMVDLGFLLISFFVIATELSRPRTMDFFMPKDGNASELAESDAMTVLLDRDHNIHYYVGDWKKAVQENKIVSAGLAGRINFRNAIISKQAELDANPQRSEGRDGLMVLVKPSDQAAYDDIIAILDETHITGVKKKALVAIAPEEITWLKAR